MNTRISERETRLESNNLSASSVELVPGKSGKRRIPGTAFVRVVTLGILAILMAPAHAGTLRPETVAAWNTYIQQVDRGLQERLCNGGRFLWAFEEDGRAARVRNGEILVVQAPGQNPHKVPNGLIHHWIGVVFVPKVKLDDVINVTRDYDRYKEFYTPYVVDSKSIYRSGMDDRFSMRLMNRSFFLKSALDADYRSKIVRLDDHHSYSVAETTRVQEIEEHGEPGEHSLPEGHGEGYIWKLHSIARLEERDGGVYLELEAIALSRDIPLGFRFAMDPVVRRVSRNSLITSLRQTADALHRNCGAEINLSYAAGHHQ
jgi:hypothetical protein